MFDQRSLFCSRIGLFGWMGADKMRYAISLTSYDPLFQSSLVSEDMAREQLLLTLLITLWFGSVNIADAGKKKSTPINVRIPQPCGGGQHDLQASRFWSESTRYKSSPFDETDTDGPWCYKDSKHGIRAFGVKGSRSLMADRFRVIDHYGYLGFALFDGIRGSEAAQDAASDLLPSIINDIRNGYADMDVKQVVLEAINRFDNASVRNDDLGNSGTTALVGLVLGEKLYIANIGNSRVVAKLNGTDEPWQLTRDHVITVGPPPTMEPFVRATRSGAKIDFRRHSFKANGIDTARALGPLKNDEPWLTSEPDIRVIDLQKNPIDYLVLATKGLWKRCSNRYVIDYISTHMKSEYYGADKLAKDLDNDQHPTDNISIIVVKFMQKRHYPTSR